ncbi:MAG: hypothetical protein GKS01_10515 [Alphaproteobacteria bacterium]|nr:hypothetical protein [Alphaproteobacteria bacterium]
MKLIIGNSQDPLKPKLGLNRKSVVVTLLALVLVLPLAGITSGIVHAAECKVSGHWLLLAYNKALSNNYRFSCSSGAFKPYPTGLTCEGRHGVRGNSGVIGSSKLHAKFFMRGPNGAYGLRNGWKISSYKARGGPIHKIKWTRLKGGKRTKNSKRTDHKLIYFKAAVKIGKKFSYRMTRFSIKKNGASCNNMPAVLTSAFGQ